MSTIVNARILTDRFIAYRRQSWNESWYGKGNFFWSLMGIFDQLIKKDGPEYAEFKVNWAIQNKVNAKSPKFFFTCDNQTRVLYDVLQKQDGSTYQYKRNTISGMETDWRCLD